MRVVRARTSPSKRCQLQPEPNGTATVTMSCLREQERRDGTNAVLKCVPTNANNR